MRQGASTLPPEAPSWEGGPTPIVCVYVPRKSEKNLRIGMDGKVWGWKERTIKRAFKQDGWREIEADHYLLLGHCNVPRKIDDIADITVGEVVVARVTKGLFVDRDVIWPDDNYPYRIRFDILGLLEGVNGQELGYGAMEALRLSCTLQGAPLYDPSGRALDGLTSVVKQQIPKGGDREEVFPHGGLPLPEELDRKAWIFVRAEQARLRREKFRKAPQITCALCGRTLPSQLVHTAHIKRRSESTYQERCDLSNIMGACTLGCDALYEHGYIYVDTDGRIRASQRVDGAEDLVEAALVFERRGRFCTEFSEASAPYFAWHRVTVAGAPE